MSITIDWASLTTGPSGLALADSIRDFIHDKFQQVTLPRFIRSVQVHSFDFGDECPVVELKDISDPLPEFYDDGDDGDTSPEEEGQGESDGAEEEEEEAVAGAIEATASSTTAPKQQAPHRPTKPAPPPPATTMKPPPPTSTAPRLPALNLRPSALAFPPQPPDRISTPFLSRSATPSSGTAIPGGTSNFTSYFHLPLSSAGLSGTATPLLPPWGGAADQHQHASPFFAAQADNNNNSARPSSGATTTHRPPRPTHPATAPPTPPPSPDRSQDLQTTLHISYSGSLSLSLTAEILLDYPMPSFVGIPLKLQITGLAFDGVALLAYLRHGGGAEERRKVQFCFLGREDAGFLVGHGGDGGERGDEEERGAGGLLREIRVESEIGRQEGGKQVLKNVGKVERFVLEQVGRIFEDEFVWPSFWTFLV